VREGLVVVGEGAVVVEDGTPGGGPARGARLAVAAYRLVVAESAVADGQGSAVEVRDAAALARSGRTELATTYDQVAGERAGSDGQGATLVEDTPAEGR